MLTGNRTRVSCTIEPLDQDLLDCKTLALVQRSGHVEPKVASSFTGLNHGGPIFSRDPASHAGRKIIEKNQGLDSMPIGPEIDIGASRILRAKPWDTRLDLNWRQVFGSGCTRREQCTFFTRPFARDFLFLVGFKWPVGLRCYSTDLRLEKVQEETTSDQNSI